MRELTKSMLSYTWGVSMFGVQQIANLLMPGNEKPMSKATASFDQVTTATVDQLGTTARSAFRMCDQLQRVMVDMMLGGIFMSNCDSGQGMGGGKEPGRPQSSPAGASSSAGATVPSWGWGPPRGNGGSGPMRSKSWTPQDRPISSPPPSVSAGAGSQDIGWGPMP